MLLSLRLGFPSQVAVPSYLGTDSVVVFRDCTVKLPSSVPIGNMMVRSNRPRVRWGGLVVRVADCSERSVVQFPIVEVAVSAGEGDCLAQTPGIWASAGPCRHKEVQAYARHPHKAQHNSPQLRSRVRRLAIYSSKQEHTLNMIDESSKMVLQTPPNHCSTAAGPGQPMRSAFRQFALRASPAIFDELFLHPPGRKTAAGFIPHQSDSSE